QLEATIGVQSIDTREPQRDAHLKSADFFDAEKYPVMSFKSRRIERDRREPDQYRAYGDLTLHGVTKEIVLDVIAEGRTRDPWGNDRAGFSATGRLNRKDFGLG